jgi:hypothetical protein
LLQLACPACPPPSFQSCIAFMTSLQAGVVGGPHASFFAALHHGRSLQ